MGYAFGKSQCVQLEFGKPDPKLGGLSLVGAVRKRGFCGKVSAEEKAEIQKEVDRINERYYAAFERVYSGAFESAFYAGSLEPLVVSLSLFEMVDLESNEKGLGITFKRGDRAFFLPLTDTIKNGKVVSVSGFMAWASSHGVKFSWVGGNDGVRVAIPCKGLWRTPSFIIPLEQLGELSFLNLAISYESYLRELRINYPVGYITLGYCDSPSEDGAIWASTRPIADALGLGDDLDAMFAAHALSDAARALQWVNSQGFVSSLENCESLIADATLASARLATSIDACKVVSSTRRQWVAGYLSDDERIEYPAGEQDVTTSNTVALSNGVAVFELPGAFATVEALHTHLSSRLESCNRQASFFVAQCVRFASHLIGNEHYSRIQAIATR